MFRQRLTYDFNLMSNFRLRPLNGFRETREAKKILDAIIFRATTFDKESGVVLKKTRDKINHLYHLSK